MEEKDKCTIALEEAIKKAIEVAEQEVENTFCTKEAFDKALLNVLADMLGIESNPGDPSECSLILKGVTEGICKDFYKQRQYVMCRAWQIIKEWHKEGKVANMGRALREAWDELKTKCLEIGVVV